MSVFTEAKAVLVSSGWGQAKGEEGLPPNTICLGIALNRVGANYTDWRVLNTLIKRRWPKRLEKGRRASVIRFNDHPRTTWKDIETVLALAHEEVSKP